MSARARRRALALGSFARNGLIGARVGVAIDVRGGAPTAGAGGGGGGGAAIGGAATGEALAEAPAIAGWRDGANSSSIELPAPTVMTPPHTEQRARMPAEGIFVGSTRKTERHSGHETF